MTMKKILCCSILGMNMMFASAQEPPSNHADMAKAILDFLSRTELCLNSCQDAESAKAAIPQLKKLKAECDRLAAAQQMLPEPTVQDYMTEHNNAATFNTIWKAIRAHIERLETAQIMTREMRDILYIAPPEQK